MPTFQRLIRFATTASFDPAPFLQWIVNYFQSLIAPR